MAKAIIMQNYVMYVRRLGIFSNFPFDHSNNNLGSFIMVEKLGVDKYLTIQQRLINL
jgi:hypothetical protein